MTDRHLAAALAGSAASSAATGTAVHSRSALGLAEAQRWRWVLHPDSIDLYVNEQTGDEDRHLVLLSSGGALHHARVALAADGHAAKVRLLPDGDPAHLATVTAAQRIEVTADALASYEALGEARRVALGKGPTTADLADMTAAAQAEGVRLMVLDPDQAGTLAKAHGLTPHKHSTDRFGVLCGDDDAPERWIRAGAALSAVTVIATRRGLSVAPSSTVVRDKRGRAALRGITDGVPYLALRIGSDVS